MDSSARDAPGLTKSTVLPIRINSFVMISTISRTCKGARDRVSCSTGLLTSSRLLLPQRELRESCATALECRLGWDERDESLPVLGLHWHECTGGLCLHSCGGRRLHCTSSGACGGIYCVWVTAAGWLEGVSTVHARAAVAQRYLPIEHVEVEPGEHAFARPSSREGTPSSHHHIQHSKGDEVLLLWNLESQQSVTMAWPY